MTNDALKTAVVELLADEGRAVPDWLFDAVFEALMGVRSASRTSRLPSWAEAIRVYPAWRQFRSDWGLHHSPRRRTQREEGRTVEVRREHALVMLHAAIIRKVLMEVEQRRMAAGVARGLPVTLEEADEALAGLEDVASHLVDGYQLLRTSRILLTGTREFAGNSIHRDLAEACGKVKYPPVECEVRPVLPSLRDGRRKETIAGKYGGFRDVVTKTDEDEIKDVLITELAAYHHSAAARHVTVNKLINGSPLIAQRFREDHPEVRHRVLVTLLVGADPDEALSDRSSEYASAVAARVLAYATITRLALAARGSGLVVDVVVFDLRSKEWHGVRFALGAVQVSREAGLAWCNLTGFDRLLPRFFSRWPINERDSRSAEPVLLAPREFFARQIQLRQYDYYPVVTIRRARELLWGVNESIAALPNPPIIKRSWADAVVDTTIEAPVSFRFARTSSTHRREAAEFVEGDSEAFVEGVVDLVIGPVTKRRTT